MKRATSLKLLIYRHGLGMRGEGDYFKNVLAVIGYNVSLT